MYATLIFCLGKTEASATQAAPVSVCNRDTAKTFLMQMYLKCHIPVVSFTSQPVAEADHEDRIQTDSAR